MKLPVDTTHFMDKYLRCDCCKKMILIKHNQVGGFWHLRGWKNRQGLQFFGQFCSTCYDTLNTRMTVIR